MSNSVRFFNKKVKIFFSFKNIFEHLWDSLKDCKLLNSVGRLFCTYTVCMQSSADPEGGWGTGGQDPPGKSQIIWVSIGKVGPPPPGKSGTLKNDSFLRN